ncbi:ribosome-associated translation inhibitor RaiA [Cohnella pontilimi]|uniref:Ribosome hibernation promoting factor n=1 Tax=Cohnella pontilimi TaxID=2564100 RepID=A0A4V5LSA3_9BACL|nr:ribosome-associated translation inhibitor RaiA [Cohnella pontilimi]TJY41969.1 ribosome-associated translation inhibitor RaiA [Cohnella pontilimi]
MQYNIRGQRMEVTDALRDYVGKKLSRLERYFEAPPQSDVQVTMAVTKGQHAVEVTIPLPGVTLRAEEKRDDMYASIDCVVDKLERQIRKHKTKLNRKLRHEGTARLFKEEASATGSPPVSTLTHEDEDELELVRTKRFSMKPMDVEEAILQMNMVGHSFYVFANTDTKQVNVVYRRSDGKYGLIETAE